MMHSAVIWQACLLDVYPHSESKAVWRESFSNSCHSLDTSSLPHPPHPHLRLWISLPSCSPQCWGQVFDKTHCMGVSMGEKERKTFLSQKEKDQVSQLCLFSSSASSKVRGLLYGRIRCACFFALFVFAFLML